MLIEHQGKRPQVHPYARIAPKEIWAIQKPLDFPRYVFSAERMPQGETIMRPRRPKPGRAQALQLSALSRAGSMESIV